MGYKCGTFFLVLMGFLADAGAMQEEQRILLPGATSPVKVKNGRQVGRLVDLNSASKIDLKKLPGVNDAVAEKIIADRPFATKAHLVTHGIIDMATYDGLKNNVIAKQPFKDAAKNAAIYQKTP